MQGFTKRFAKNRMAMIGLGVLLVYLFLAVFANLLFDPELVLYQDYNAILEGCSTAHWFGTDDLGRDLFVRLVYGSRASLLIGFAATMVGMICGAVLGAFCAYVGGVIDGAVMRFLDVLYSIPFMLLGMLVVALLGKTMLNLILAVAIANTLSFAKITRGCVLSITEQDYIKAARACGTKPLKIVTSHILPNAVSILATNAVFTMVSSMMAASGLSFLGIGVQPPTPEWGNILADGKGFVQSDPRMVVFPILCIVLATVSITLVGDGIRDALLPKSGAGEVP